MRTDYSMRRICVGALAGMPMLLLAAGAMASERTSVVVPFTITYPQPTCDLTFNGSSSLTYQLGTMSPGSEMQHSPLTVSVNCKDSQTVKTALTARNVSGTLQGGNDSVMMRVNNQDVTSGPLLWLETAGKQRVKLTGQESDAFCTRADTSLSTPNTCQLKPVTNIPANSPVGNISVTIGFEVVYPA